VSAEHVSKVRLFLPGRDVPDPYYGGPEGFEQVLDLVEAGLPRAPGRDQS